MLTFFGTGDRNDVIEDMETTEDEVTELELNGTGGTGDGPPISSMKIEEDDEAPSVIVGGVSALILVFPDLLLVVLQPLLVFVIVCPFTLLVVVSFTTCSVVR